MPPYYNKDKLRKKYHSVLLLPCSKTLEASNIIGISPYIEKLARIMDTVNSSKEFHHIQLLLLWYVAKTLQPRTKGELAQGRCMEHMAIEWGREPF